MTPEAIGAWAGLLTILVGGVLAVIRELRRGRAEKANPELDGSGAAICKELRSGREEQAKFNRALAAHLGMAPLAAPERKASNGR